MVVITSWYTERKPPLHRSSLSGSAPPVALVACTKKTISLLLVLLFCSFVLTCAVVLPQRFVPCETLSRLYLYDVLFPLCSPLPSFRFHDFLYLRREAGSQGSFFLHYPYLTTWTSPLNEPTAISLACPLLRSFLIPELLSPPLNEDEYEHWKNMKTSAHQEPVFRPELTEFFIIDFLGTYRHSTEYKCNAGTLYVPLIHAMGPSHFALFTTRYVLCLFSPFSVSF
jgi:hypothetical protein